MLLNLKISNIAIIKEAVVDFSNGLNVLTGETGAGKSIIIDAINAILGERTSRELIRTGCDNAEVSAFFDDVNDSVKTVLNELGVGCDDNSLAISRKISLDGKNVCKVNGVSGRKSGQFLCYFSFNRHTRNLKEFPLEIRIQNYIFSYRSPRRGEI
jgi:DNA repair protein RecN (Recombination protein N)